MISYKKLVFLMVLFLIFLFSFHVTVWNMYTKYVFPDKYDIGDLGRMSYKLDSLTHRTAKVYLPKQHINFDKWDETPIDILTIGDSFSNGGGSGKNSYYQDYLCTFYNLKILNIQDIPMKNSIETLQLLLTSSMIDKLKPKAIIIESTEPQILNRFSINISRPESNITNETAIKYLIQKYKYNKPKINFINNINVNAAQYNILYNFDDNAYTANCYITKLNKGLFTSKDPYSLLFYKETIKYNDSITSQKVEKLNANLNSLAVKLKTKGIKLYFDKFNLYSKYVIENKYGQSSFFEQLRPMKKEYELIDTKAILGKEIDRGVTDVFYSDDTHWSYKASEAIAKNLSVFQDWSK